MRYFTLVLVSVLIFACGNFSASETKSPELIEEEQLVDEIHRLHDVETMPKMGLLVRLGKQLDSLEGANETVVLELKNNLEKADDEMMDWMVQFKWQEEPTSVQKRIEYYTTEVKKLEELKEVILGAIDAAEKELKK